MKLLSTEAILIIKKIFNIHHPYFGEIMLNWDKIVGYKYSNLTTPISIKTIKEKGKTLNLLNVRVTNSAASLELAFLQDIIIERIAIYLGHKAIHKLRFIIDF